MKQNTLLALTAVGLTGIFAGCHAPRSVSPADAQQLANPGVKSNKMVLFYGGDPVSVSQDGLYNSGRYVIPPNIHFSFGKDGKLATLNIIEMPEPNYRDVNNSRVAGQFYGAAAQYPLRPGSIGYAYAVNLNDPQAVVNAVYPVYVHTQQLISYAVQNSDNKSVFVVDGVTYNVQSGSSARNDGGSLVKLGTRELVASGDVLPLLTAYNQSLGNILTSYGVDLSNLNGQAADQNSPAGIFNKYNGREVLR